MNDGVVLMYCKDGVLYPVGLTESQHTMLQLTVKAIASPLPVMFSKPLGRAINYANKGDK